MSDIPEDILAIAASVFGRDEIARAILAERERCAKIAETSYGGLASLKACHHIADAIRSTAARPTSAPEPNST